MQKKMTTLTKGLIMTIVTLLATTITTTGIPATAIGWEVLGITAAGTIAIYLGKNAVFPSVSVLGTVDLRDLISGALVALGSAFSNFVATWVTVGLNEPINWHQLITLGLTTMAGYFAKNFIQQNQNT